MDYSWMNSLIEMKNQIELEQALRRESEKLARENRALDAMQTLMLNGVPPKVVLSKKMNEMRESFSDASDDELIDVIATMYDLVIPPEGYAPSSGEVIE